jgi:Asp-tRNA(Asn)/Glu-tRNA(Gln) amidotransferase A subunit family amidase
MSAASAREIAAAVRGGERSAMEVARETLAKIRVENGVINAFTAVTEDRALAQAAAVDASRAAGRDPGPLAGAPFAVKNLYDVAGLATIAGSKIDSDRAPAARDAALVSRLTRAGAVLVGALNMDEYAFGFSTENTLRRDAQPARPYARGGRLFRRLGRRSRRFADPSLSGLGHQRLDPRARRADRRLRAAADLWSIEPRRHAALFG